MRKGGPVFADSVLQNKRREREREHMSHVAGTLFLINKPAVKDIP